MINKSVIFVVLILLLSSACGTEAEIDDSTKEDWEKNLALRHEYRNDVIFTATETTSPTGKKEMSLVANDRDTIISIFERLELARVPSMHKKRMKILEMIEQSPGGERLDMSRKLATDISNFWEDVLKYAKKHGITPEE